MTLYLLLHPGFDSSKGADSDFFQAFDSVKEVEQSGGNDGFDANADAFGATGWGENTNTTSTTTESSARVEDNAENLLKMTIDNVDGNRDKTKKDDTHRLKSRRKREGGGRSRAANRDVEAKVDPDNAGSGGEKKERRSRKEGSTGDADKELPRQRRRSTSRSRRKDKARGKKKGDKGNSGGDVNKKVSRSGSFRSLFNRKQENEDA